MNNNVNNTSDALILDSQEHAGSDGRAVILEPRSRLILTVLLISAFVVFLNETILNVAIPQIMEHLGISANTGQWLTTAYLLTMAIVIPVTGFLLQRFTTRSMYITAMSLFSIGTFVAAMAPDFTTLILGRIVQAVGTAIMMPLLMTTVMVLVPSSIRGRIMGMISIVMAVAPAIGPSLSGLVLSFLDWRWLFWLVLPIALTTLLIGALRITNAGETRKLRIDILSVVISAFAFSGLIFGLSSFGDAARGEALISPWIPLGIGAAALVIFILRQVRLQHTNRALLDLRTFRSSAFSSAMILMGIAMMSLLGTIILLPIYMQNVLMLEPLQAGLFLLPGGLVMGILGPIVGRLYDGVGARKLLIPGAIVVSAALWLLATFNQFTAPPMVIVAHVTLSIGLAFIFTPLFTLGLSSVPPQLYSHASATLGTIQQIGGAAGTALFVTVLTTVSVNLGNQGSSVVAATAGGMQFAFLSGAILSVVAIGLAIAIKKPASPEELARELLP
ncbi:DHA2 family efflux MFS transporter permease subunit [Alpinimonas psychrophila]|uniref:DHA2 family lincomycin resistance protein-like MFS transporter n=1 Tax=Alpinimonas psychrophila TaxID=748908 RepID=A0A7W3PNW7_9MICO|nr:MDR family MFS transporter [Alpinimonas psychrophila]MBA8828676.1 DHA2 family lincomycin resistance protein-like MFS transporter [Alpinimonas psychrophila]